MQLAQMMHWKKKVSIEDAVFFQLLIGWFSLCMCYALSLMGNREAALMPWWVAGLSFWLLVAVCVEVMCFARYHKEGGFYESKATRIQRLSTETPQEKIERLRPLWMMVCGIAATATFLFAATCFDWLL